MKASMKVIASGLSLVALSACMGGGDEDSGTVTSTGILSLEIPDQESYDSLPNQDLRDLVDDVVAANGGTATPTSGATSYHGEFAASVGEAVIWGPAGISVDGSSMVTYTFTATNIDDPDNANASVSGSVSGSSMESGGIFSGGLNLDNTFGYDPDSTDLDPEVSIAINNASIDGAFNDSNEVFGGITGTASGPGVDEDVLGLFYAN